MANRPLRVFNCVTNGPQKIIMKTLHIDNHCCKLIFFMLSDLPSSLTSCFQVPDLICSFVELNFYHVGVEWTNPDILDNYVSLYKKFEIS